MRTRVAILNLVFLVFLVSLVSATTLSEYKPQRVDENFSFCQTCEDSTYIILSNIKTPNSTEIINTNMTDIGGASFCYNYTPNQIGTYDFVGISDGCLNTFAVYVPVTADGNLYDTGDSLMLIFIAVFFIMMILGFYKIQKSVDFEKWYNKIEEKYVTRNFVKWALSAIVYNIMREPLIVYFLLGLPIILTLTNLVFLYNVTSIALYIQAVFYIYLALIVIVGIVFLSYIQEWFMDAIDKYKDIDWGIQG